MLAESQFGNSQNFLNVLTNKIVAKSKIPILTGQKPTEAITNPIPENYDASFASYIHTLIHSCNPPAGLPNGTEWRLAKQAIHPCNHAISIHSYIHPSFKNNEGCPFRAAFEYL